MYIYIFSSANMRTVNKKRAVLITNINKKPDTEEETEQFMLMTAYSEDFHFEVNNLASKLLFGNYVCFLFTILTLSHY